jgi:hypothetical protein
MKCYDLFPNVGTGEDAVRNQTKDLRAKAATQAAAAKQSSAPVSSPSPLPA